MQAEMHPLACFELPHHRPSTCFTEHGFRSNAFKLLGHET